MVGVCEKCEEEIANLWEGGHKIGPDPERKPYLGHHGICPRYKQALWKMIEERRLAANMTDAEIEAEAQREKNERLARAVQVLSAISVEVRGQGEGEPTS